MEKTCKTCINLCNKRGKVCKHYKGEVQEMMKEIDRKLTVEEIVKIIQEEGYYDFERNEVGGIELEEDIKYNLEKAEEELHNSIIRDLRISQIEREMEEELEGF